MCIKSLEVNDYSGWDLVKPILMYRFSYSKCIHRKSAERDTIHNSRRKSSYVIASIYRINFTFKVPTSLENHSGTMFIMEGSNIITPSSGERVTICK